MIGQMEKTRATDYPFESHWFDTADGRMHYVDEGTGPSVVLVHGTPTWSYLYRHLIHGLSRKYRVIAPDHLGFGRSDKPENADYRPKAHARNLAALMNALELRDVALAVHDFGGPIGLSYAIERPENVRGLVLFNTWLWSLAGTSAETMSRLLGGRLGKLLYTRFNFSPRVILKAAFGDRRKLTKALHAKYLEPFPTAADRVAPWVFARELIGSTDWYESLWNRRDVVARKPALLLWGMKDPAFGRAALERWKDTLENARVVEIEGAGHFVQEEAPEITEREVASFLATL